MKRFLIPTALSAIALTAIAPLAQAHYLWIEQNATSARVYYGEFDGNLREVSPGRLDQITQPVITLVSDGKTKNLAPKREAGSFALPARAGNKQSLIVNDANYAVSEKTVRGLTTRSAKTLSTRHVPDMSAQQPTLTLDVVPTGKVVAGGVEVQVFFKNQPLPKAKVNVVTPSGWSRILDADDQGKAVATMPWQGFYLIEVKYEDATAGERSTAAGGKEKYDVATYRTTLTFAPQTAGIAALPAVAPATPSEYVANK